MVVDLDDSVYFQIKLCPHSQFTTERFRTGIKHPKRTKDFKLISSLKSIHAWRIMVTKAEKNEN